VEEWTQCITPEWPKYYDIVKAKYERRIERFLAIVADPKPVMVLCRWPTHVVKQLKIMFSLYFQKNNVFFVNSTTEPNDAAFPWIHNCYTEANGTWNQNEVWQSGIDVMASRI
jgi:hypothetical protein